MAVKKPVDLPEKFGRYRILKLLGKGGMGAVYLARDEDLGRDVALKVPQLDFEETPQALERFYQEARAAAAFRHPNICPVFEVGEIDGVHYLTMAFIDGKPLTQFGRSGKPLPQKKVAEMVRKIALALAEAHKNGVIHRDLKPANVMIDIRNEPIVMDFGLARRDRPGDSRITQSGMIMGSPAYMSPEQIRDIRATGTGCDIYSLGVVLYELLSHRLPFLGDTMSVLSQVLVDPPPPPSKFRPDLDPALEAICLKALAKQPEDRHASMDEFAQELLRYLRGELVTPKSVPAAKEEAISLSDLGGRRSMMMAYRDMPLEKLGQPRKKRKPGEDSTVAEKAAAKKRPRSAEQERSAWLYIGIGTGGATIVVVGVILFLLSLNPSGGKTVPMGDGTSKARVSDNTKDDNREIEPPPPARPSRTLFNGKDRTGWVVERGEDAWRVTDGELFFNADETTEKGWLVTNRLYGDYLLTLQFKLAPGGNSGVALRMSPGESKPLSVQIQDDSSPRWADTRPQDRTGALFAVTIDQKADLRPVGQWNDLEIELRDRLLRVAVNGKETLRRKLDDSDVAKRLRPRGRIGLEHNASSVHYRDIKLVEYSASRPAPAIANPIGARVDLLKLIDPKTNGKGGDWIKTADGILTPVAKWPVLQIPYDPPAAYRIDLLVERQLSPQYFGIGVGFRAGPKRRTMLMVDGGFNADISGLSTVDKKQAHQNVTTTRGTLLRPQVASKLSLVVRRGDIHFFCDGRSIFSWKGKVLSLAIDPSWKKEVPNDWDLFFMAQGRCLIREMTLTPLK